MIVDQIKIQPYSNKVQYLQVLIIAFTILGFETVSFMSPLYAEYGRNISIIYRLVYVVIGLFIGLRYLGPKINISKSMSVILLFWVIYLSRAIYDTIFKQEFTTSYLLEFWAFAFLLCFLPIFFFIPLINYTTINFARKSTFVLSILVNILGLNNNYKLVTQGIIARFDANEILNSITYGQTGVILIIMSLTYYFSANKYKYLYVFFIVLGLINIGLAASRGPFVQLFVVSVYFILIKVKKNHYSGILILISILIMISIYLKDYLFVFDSVFTRLMAPSGTYDLRHFLFIDSWNMFLRNPFFGNGVIGKDTHNIVLESFASMGTLGGILIIIIYRNAYTHIKAIVRIKSLDWLALILLMLLVGALTSGAIWDNFALWPLLGLVANLFSNRILYFDKNSTG